MKVAFALVFVQVPHYTFLYKPPPPLLPLPPCPPGFFSSRLSIRLDTQPILRPSFPLLLLYHIMSPTGSSRASLLGSQREHKPFDKTEDTDDDKHSTISHDSGVPRAEHALDALRLVAGDRVRHARCAPEFLEEIATKGAHDELRKASGNNVKVIGGAEARSFFRNYLRCAHILFDPKPMLIVCHYRPCRMFSQFHSDHNKSSARHPNDKITNEIMPSPIVFAVTVFDATIKCVDYYMTWRGTKVSLCRHRRRLQYHICSLPNCKYRSLVGGKVLLGCVPPVMTSFRGF